MALMWHEEVLSRCATSLCCVHSGGDCRLVRKSVILVVTSATLVVTGATLVVTMFLFFIFFNRYY